MNRRRKKQQKTDYLALLKEHWSKFEIAPYKQKVVELWQTLPKFHQRALLIVVPVVTLIAIIPFPRAENGITKPQSNNTQRVEVDINTSGLSEQFDSAISGTKSDVWQEYVVKNGDTLAQVFRTNGLPMADLNALVKVEGNDKPLSYIKKGQLVRYKLAKDGSLDILQLEKKAGSVMFFRLSDGGFGRSK